MAILKESTKLWYGKYFYKAVVSCNHAYLANYWHSGYRPNKAHRDIKELISIIGRRECRLRGEMNLVSVFTNEEAVIQDLEMLLGDDVREIWRPDPKKQHLLTDGRTIICKTPPEHTVKVTLKWGKLPESFGQWVDSNLDKVRIGTNSLYRLRKYNSGGFYFYLRDEKVLSLVNLMIHEHISRIDKLVYEEIC